MDEKGILKAVRKSRISNANNLDSFLLSKLVTRVILKDEFFDL